MTSFIEGKRAQGRQRETYLTYLQKRKDLTPMEFIHFGLGYQNRSLRHMMMMMIHTTIVNTYLSNRQHNKVANIIPLTAHHSETTLARATRHTLAQLRTNKRPLLLSYLNKIDEDKHPLPLFPPCKLEPHTTNIKHNSRYNSHICGRLLWMGNLLVE